MHERTRRLHILDETEVSELFGLPRFDDEQQLVYFSLSVQEALLLGSLHSVKSCCLFILQLGYFKYRHQFYVFDSSEVRADIEHVQARYFPQETLTDIEVTKVTRLKQQGLILELFNFHADDRSALANKAQQVANISTKPLYIFRELITYLAKRRWVTPAYSSLQDIVGRALSTESERLTQLLQNLLKPGDVDALQALLDDSDGLHKITQLRHQPKNASVTEMKTEVQRGRDLAYLYQLLQTLLPELSISNESVSYYASLVDHYSVYRLKRMERWTAYLYLLCYVRFRYQKLNDNLIISFKHHVKRFADAAEASAKEQVYTRRVEINRNVSKTAEILELVLSDFPPDTPFSTFQQAVFDILKREQLEQVGNYIREKVVFDETEFAWEHLDKTAASFKMHLRHAVRAAEFTGSFTRDPVTEALSFLRQAFLKDKSLNDLAGSSFPIRHIARQDKRYLYRDEDTPSTRDTTRPLANRYEFHTYQQLKQGLDAGDIHCRDSIRFRSLEDDLISAEHWHRDKANLIAELDLPLLSTPIDVQLADLKVQLETRLLEVNQRIASGDNEHFKLKRQRGKDGWTLRYPKAEAADEVNHPFYSQLRQTDVRAVLEFAQNRCGFMNAFEHVLDRYAKSAAHSRSLTACLIAWGSNMGLGKMSEISDLGFDTLASTSQNFIRPETLKAANDIVSNEIAKLPVFQDFDIDDKVHSSSDGQKFETGVDTFNARYAYKYFGKRKGVVAYTVVANHVPVNAFVIGADEHESHYVFDGLFNISTTIKPEIHSTDTHGTNELNFALLHLFGYQFAPRYKDIRTKLATSLYGFQHPSQYPALVLKPIRKLNETLIVNEWDNALRVFVSLAYKNTTQSVIVGKLSSYTRANSTKRALWEYDNIIRSLYLLDYVDLPVLRRSVQTAINRGENYHQLKRAVSFANFGRLRFRTEQDQTIWNDCARLITNCVILFNSSLLGTLIDAKAARGDTEAVARLKKVSPVAWQHINFAGRYEFSSDEDTVDLTKLIEGLV